MVIIRSPRLRVKLRLPWLRNETDGPDFQLRAEDAQALLDGSGRVERDVLRGRQLRDRLDRRTRHTSGSARHSMNRNGTPWARASVRALSRSARLRKDASITTGRPEARTTSARCITSA